MPIQAIQAFCLLKRLLNCCCADVGVDDLADVFPPSAIQSKVHKPFSMSALACTQQSSKTPIPKAGALFNWLVPSVRPTPLDSMLFSDRQIAENGHCVQAATTRN